MSVAHLEVLVEEASAEAALRVLLPKMSPAMSFQVFPHDGKQALLRRLPQRLKGYRAWLPDNWRIVVLADRDRDDCKVLKQSLEEMAAAAGLLTPRSAKAGKFSLVTRLAIEELEAWYFGDWDAVRQAYPKVPPTVPSKAKFRLPDDIQGGTWEALEGILKRAGYFLTGLRKIECARAIAQHMDPARNTSPSFQLFRNTIIEMTQ